eukprot:gnl/Trimastix_PCT/1190.p1 GENE.gnl/Trimastix_PCT/1190~~gnl/Trimastix_PCT/1190.p1  ORF type:complete len:925 (-),score=283.90 gnl/Trimastix_PCT/1190:338-2899(-)
MECRHLRNICVMGHLHHGKTTLMDFLIQMSHSSDIPERYTDARFDEKERCISVKSAPVSLVLQNPKGKSYMLNMLDTPGHVDFSGEIAASLRLSDGAILVVDAAEGVMMQTKRVLTYALQQQTRVCLVITKLDRLVIELKLPPRDAYFKLRQIIEELNLTVREVDATAPVFSPTEGNVCFASGRFQFLFSLASIAQDYARRFGFQAAPFTQRLWGDIYYNPQTRKFSRNPANVPSKEDPSKLVATKRAVVQFVLEPMYKMTAILLGETEGVIRRTLEPLGVYFTRDELKQDASVLLRTGLQRFFEDAAPFVQMCVDHIPGPVEAAPNKIPLIYTGSMDSLQARAMVACDPNGPLMINVTKLFAAADGRSFRALGRVFSGTIRAGQPVRVLGEGYRPPQDLEDAAQAHVEQCWLSMTRYRLGVASVPAGSWVLLDGVDGNIFNTATITDPRDPDGSEDTRIFRPLRHFNCATMKLAVEPLDPKTLPKMVEGLRSVVKTYPLVNTKVEESGEHVILAVGELGMDCVLHDLREMYGQIEVKVSDPFISLCETVVDKPILKCFAETPNHRNKLTMVAEPLDKGMGADIEQGGIDLTWDRRRIQKTIQDRYGWDLLAARNIWAFGPDNRGPNVLVDDTLPSEVNAELLYDVRASVVQGFQWGTKQGPLCDEPMRDVKFKLLDALVDEDPMQRFPTQIVPTARRVCYSAFLMATPRLMEPILYCEVQAPADCVSAVYTVLSRRRGHVTQDAPCPGNPFYTVQAYVPVLESFGFETDLRAHTHGQAFVQSVFDHWALAPGDPLDKTITLKPLEIAEPHALSRELMVKTRRRKGLSEDVAINKFFDDPMLRELAKQEAGLL